MRSCARVVRLFLLRWRPRGDGCDDMRRKKLHTFFREFFFPYREILRNSRNLKLHVSMRKRDELVAKNTTLFIEKLEKKVMAAHIVNHLELEVG